MSPEYLSPGVYVEEIDRGSKPIEGAGTACAAFVGFAERGPVNQPTFIPNWTEFVNNFGSFIKGGYLAPAVYGYFQNGGGRCYVSRLPGGEAEGGELKAVAALPSSAKPELESLTISALEAGDAGTDITIEVVKPGGEGATEDQFNLIVRKGKAEAEKFDNLTLKKGRSVRNILEVVNKESKLIRVAEKESTLSIAEKLPAPGTYPLAMAASGTTAIVKLESNEIVGDTAARTGIAGLEIADDVTMVACPDLMALYQANYLSMEAVKGVQLAMIAHCENLKDRFAILDCPPGMNPQQVKEWRMNTAGYDTKYGAVYYPWIKVANPMGGDPITVPPSGYMAGIYARSDNERGVHKAPANEVIRGATGVEMLITKSEQDILNPIGVNCIRSFPGRGIRVWGARTLSSDASWRYINVRRLFNFVEKSIQTGTQWIVFEPNDAALWARIRRDISAFLSNVWRTGALFGATPAQAFYVKCDEETNPPAVRDAGQVIIEIGLAPVKPAEFVIFRISQWAAGSEASE